MDLLYIFDHLYEMGGDRMPLKSPDQLTRSITTNHHTNVKHGLFTLTVDTLLVAMASINYVEIKHHIHQMNIEIQPKANEQT